MKTGVKRALVAELFQKQEGRCCYCDRPMIIMPRGTGRIPPNAATLEHLVTHRRKGWTKRDNMAAACRECNDMRGSAMDWLTFKTYRRGEFWEFIAGCKL
ncbi:HNH endonuclease [Rhizobium leguminosarum]|uniref:5-methylcytosine-specific restriction endonuclease McrA n=1 Tax=Rhizobium leguminosarum TaxID=384 RepID=A0A7W9ZXH1_RHILE|nr:HNH endonuclease [Rhizobium leguminosarum]MBB6224598.1 5-methylcytosine-specific restriction endonuclease McrA [Rhizobium leguminosarum]